MWSLRHYRTLEIALGLNFETIEISSVMSVMHIWPLVRSTAKLLRIIVFCPVSAGL